MTPRDSLQNSAFARPQLERAAALKRIAASLPRRLRRRLPRSERETTFQTRNNFVLIAGFGRVVVERRQASLSASFAKHIHDCNKNVQSNANKNVQQSNAKVCDFSLEAAFLGRREPNDQAARPCVVNRYSMAPNKRNTYADSLEDLLGRVNALDKLEKAAAWCTLQGADGVADLKGYEDEFVAALSLPRIKHEKLLYMLKNKYHDGGYVESVN